QYNLSDDSSLVDELIETAPYEGEAIYNEIEKIVNSIQNENVRAITITILQKYKEDLLVYPAAKANHHAYKGGLAWHTFSMLRNGVNLSRLYPILNADLIIAGITLHDLGKIKEYTGYIGTDFTLEGKLKGHISIMSEEI